MPRVPLIGQPSTRDTTTVKDRLFYNSLFEKATDPAIQGAEYRVLSRPGLTAHIDPSANAAPRAIFFWNGKLYSCFGSNVYSNTTNIISGLTTSTGAAYFTEAQTAGTTISLLFSDGVRGYVISAADAATQIVDADFPNPHVKGFEWIDGFAFIATGANIRNSDLEVYTAYNPLNEITAEMYGDNIQRLTRFHNLLVAIGTTSTEFFENASNPTGSPLARVVSYAFRMGTPAPATVVKMKDSFVWVAQEPEGNLSVQVFNGQTTKISNPYVERLLYGEGSSLASANAWLWSESGHNVYVLQLPGQARTLVFDFHSGIWGEWTSDNGSGTQIQYRGIQGTFAPDTVANTPATFVTHPTTGQILRVDRAAAADESNPILWKARYSLIDYGTHMRKSYTKMVVVGDQTTSTSNLSIRYSDDDYQTFTTARTVDLAAKQPALVRLGSARRRGFEWSHSSSTQRIRLEGFDLIARGEGG